MFNYFKLTKNKRKNTEEPSTLDTWIKHGVSEFFGTIMLAFMLAGLSIAIKDGNVLEHYLLHPIIVGFYAGFIAVGLVLIIFLRWSCDLNPMVTITRILKGTNTYRYGFYKIFIQVVAGIVTGLIIHAFGKIANDSSGNTNNAIDAFKASETLFVPGAIKSNAIGATLIFFIEMVMGAILLFPIFSLGIKDKYRDLFIMFIISMSVWMGLLGNTAAINPARGLAQQTPGLFFNAGNNANRESLIDATLAMMFGNIAASFFYVLIQGVTDKYAVPLLTKAIKFKNYRSSNMRIDSQE